MLEKSEKKFLPKKFQPKITSSSGRSDEGGSGSDSITATSTFLAKILLVSNLFQNFRVKKTCNLSAFCSKFGVASNHELGQILAGVKRKKGRLSAINNLHCDITMPCLVVEQQLIISTKI